MKPLTLILAALLLVTTAAAENTAILPTPRSNPTNWVARHEGFVAIAQQGKVDVLFIGDSITDRWRRQGKAIWEKFYEPHRAANFGISGDRTQHLLWRLQQGELEGIKPKVTVLLIGTNNTGAEDDGKGRNTPAETIAGVQAVVTEVRTKLPETKILLLAIFPRGETNAPQRGQIAEINQALAKLDDGRKVTFLDIGKKFLAPDGTLPKTVMPDLLHLSESGYQIWADAMEPTLARLLQEPGQ